MTWLIIEITVGVLIFLLGWASSKHINKPKSGSKKITRRRGIYKASLTGGISGGNKETFNILFVVEEISKVADHSKIIVIDAEATNNVMSPARKDEAIRWIGRYVKTSDVKWDKRPAKNKGSTIEDIIKTPLDELSKKRKSLNRLADMVEQDDIG